ncbi:MAG: AsmA family protein [Acidobacteriaceae bacterium]|jgi:AsmA protein
MKKRWVRVLLAVVVLVVAAVLIVPLFVNADAFRPTLENQLSSALGRKVTLGHLSFSLWSGSLVADNVAVADDPTFSTNPFFQAKSLRIGVETGALLFDRQVHVTKFVAESPQVQLISGKNGTWNFSSLTRGSSAAGGSSGSSAPQVTVGKFEISNGSVVVSSVPATGKPMTYSDVNVSVEHVSLTQAMPFTVSAKLPGNGSVELKGTAGPVNQQNAVATPLQASLTVQGFDPVAAGVLPASEGVGMVADVTAQVQSDGRTLTSTGKITATHLLLSRGGTPAAQPVNVDYAIDYALQAQTGTVKDIAVHSGPATAHVTGTFQTQAAETVLNLQVSAPNMPVDAVENLLPAVGIRLPSGSQLKGGTLSAQLAITGTTQAPEIKGPVDVEGTQLQGFNLAQKIGGLNIPGVSGNVTAIQTLKAEVDSTVPQTTLTNIDADVPSVGTATGQGTVTAAGALNFALVATLKGGVATMANTAASALGGIAGGLLHSAVSSGVPLTITGTTANPVIRADLTKMVKGGLLGNQSGQKKSAGSVLKGLLGPK